MLRDFFEPTADEREQHLKTPTPAHLAIAQLAQLGKIRVVVTTNFDRLMEQALEAVGIQPVVIGTADAVRGAEPLDRVDCTVVKVHGDYLDVRFRNTPKELATFDREMNRLLDRIFDEYGLIVCGWSATTDLALQAALERAPSRRYMTYWCARSGLSETAQRLVTTRRAEVISGKDANSVFTELLEKVRDLADLDYPPLTTQMQVARVKRYLEEGENARIRLYDLVSEETERVVTRLNGPAFPIAGPRIVSSKEVASRLKQYTRLCESLVALTSTGCRWAGPDHIGLWVQTIQRVTPEDFSPDVGSLGATRSAPTLLLLFGGALAARAVERSDIIARLLVGIAVKDASQRHPVFRIMVPTKLLREDDAEAFPELGGSQAPGSEYLLQTLRSWLRPMLPNDADYTDAFDFFEYLYALLHLDARQEANERVWAPLGRFAFRRAFQRDQLPAITADIGRQGHEWPYLQAGLFGGSLTRLLRAKTQLDEAAFQQGGW